MRKAHCLVWLPLALSQPAWPASGNDGDPTPRKSMDPADAATVKQFEAKRWLLNGGGAAGDAAERSTTGSGIPGRRSCNTQIGPLTPPDVGPAGRPSASPRFGQGQDSVVIVTGSVINVCR